MPIVKVYMYTSECDSCKAKATFGEVCCYNTEEGVMYECIESGWHFDDVGKCYCPNCENMETKTKPKKTNIDIFNEAVQPLINYLNEVHDPHTTIIVTCNGAELVKGHMAVDYKPMKDEYTW